VYTIATIFLTRRSASFYWRLMPRLFGSWPHVGVPAPNRARDETQSEFHDYQFSDWLERHRPLRAL
jgi:hypothetical protein